MPDARSIVGSFLARMPGGGWLSAGEADGLLRCYGIPMVEFRRAEDAGAAIDAAAGLGGHVVIKASPGLPQAGLGDRRQGRRTRGTSASMTYGNSEATASSQGLSPDGADRQAPSDGCQKRPEPRIG